MSFAFTIVALVLVLAIAWRFLGSYMAAVFEDQVKWLAFVERPLYRVIGVDAENETHYLKCPPTGSGASSATRGGDFLQSDPSVGYRLVPPAGSVAG